MHKCIIGGNVVTETEILENHAVIIKDEIIDAILPMDDLCHYETGNGDMDYFDAHGCSIVPGFIDTHSDYIEGVIQPRPTSLMDFEMALRETEKQLLGQGITTMYHSLSLLAPRLDMENRAVRTTENVNRLVRLIHDFHTGHHLIHHRFHARYEVDNMEGFENLLGLMEQGLVHQLSFMDHTPGQGQYRNIEAYTEMFKKWQGIDSDEKLQKYLDDSGRKPKATHDMLLKLAETAHRLGIPMASHDDDAVEKLDINKEQFGMRISEFPITLEVARAAREKGFSIVMGAPNVLMGKSHSGNLSAGEAVRNGCVDILCSDYYPASLLHAVYKLADEGELSLPESVALVTCNPAKALGIDNRYGSVAVGKQADLLVIREMGECPMVYKAFIDGKLSVQYQYKVG